MRNRILFGLMAMLFCIDVAAALVLRQINRIGSYSIGYNNESERAWKLFLATTDWSAFGVEMLAVLLVTTGIFIFGWACLPPERPEIPGK